MFHRRVRSLFCTALLVALLAHCGGDTVSDADDAGVQDSGTEMPPGEIAVTALDFSGVLQDADAEISGMAWHGDELILLPQYPDFTGSYDPQSGFLYALSKADILAQLDGDEAPLVPRAIPFHAPGLSISGFEGFEAIAFAGDTAFLTVEASSAGTHAVLLKGTLAADLSRFDLDPTGQALISSQCGISNMSDETLLLADGVVVTVHEANGAGVNAAPVAHRFDSDLGAAGTLPFPPVEYRITDATAVDDANRFWAINFFWPGDHALLPTSDPIAERWGEGPTHATLETVERLIEFELSSAGITLVERPPLQLSLIDDDSARNWEAVARLDQRGFLLATDKYPGTVIAFVAADAL